MASSRLGALSDRRRFHFVRNLCAKSSVSNQRKFAMFRTMFLTFKLNHMEIVLCLHPTRQQAVARKCWKKNKLTNFDECVTSVGNM